MARPAYSEDKVGAIQDEICAAALAVFRRDGFGALSLRRIAQELGWTAAALYRYFASKEELLDAIRAEGFVLMGLALERARQSATSPRDAARGAIRAYLQFATDEPERFRLMYEMHQGELQSAPHVKLERQRAFSIAEEIASQDSASANPTLAAHLLWVSAHGLAALAMAQQLDLGCSYEELVEPLIDRIAGSQPTGEIS